HKSHGLVLRAEGMCTNTGRPSFGYLCAGVPARSTVRRGFDSELQKNKLLCGRLLVLVLDPLCVVLSLVFIGRVLESHLRLKRSYKNISLMESDWGKQAVQSAFGIVKHGGVTPINLGKSRPPP
ncbi:unnamed protein product, partial [Prunus brigantina]